jgi:hypothetical protein
MKPQNNSNTRKSLVVGAALFTIVGSLTYLGLNRGNDGLGEKRMPGEVSSADSGPSLVVGDASGLKGQSIAVPPPGGANNKSGAAKALFAVRGPVEGAPLPVAGMNPDSDKGRVVRLNPAELAAWGGIAEGAKIALPTANGEEISGTVNVVSTDLGWYRIGGTLDGQEGTFQLNASAGKTHGGIYLPTVGVGYQIQMDGSDVVLVERRLSALLCYPGVKADAQGSQRVVSGVISAGTVTQVIPEINTRPGARGVIFVDFAGGVISSTAWGKTITATPSKLSGNSITQAVTRAAEDFAPFDITLTTIRSVYNDTPVDRRMRTVVTPTDTAGPGTGGVAYRDSWKWGQSDIVCWVFNEAVKTCADTIAHEVGHTLGLTHHGTKSGKEYYGGHGGGLSIPTSWGPIMGAPFGVNLTHWSRGEYFDANNATQDDLATIGRGNNFGALVSPGAFGMVRSLPLNGSLFQTSGTLVSQSDSNVYQFSTTGGKMTATVRPTSAVGTGDFRLDLENGEGVSVAVSDPAETLGASLSQTLNSGVYRLRVIPTGTGLRPADGYKTGYSPYGSLGGYSLTGSVESANNFPAFLNPKLISATEGMPVNVGFAVTDPSNTTVTVLSQKLPGTLTLNAGSGSFGEATKFVLSGTPETGTSNGVWSVTLSARSRVGETRVEFNLVISPQSLPLVDALASSDTLISNISTSPTSPWIGVSGTRPDGKPGAITQSGVTPDRGTSSIRFDYKLPTVSKASSSLMTFFWQSDTEAGKDIVRCKVDGTLAKDMLTGQLLSLSGKRGWVQQTVLLPGTGTRRIEFEYTKDANLRSDVDRVWVCGIQIWQPPVITKSPVSSIRVVPGASASSGTFSLSAEATGASTLKWHKNGSPLSNGTSQSGSFISGADTGTLTVSGAKAGDAGVYWMVARNEKGATAVSSRCEVAVWVPPVVTSQPVAPTGLRVGDPLVLTAVVRGAQPMFYQWRKDGVAGRWSSTPSLTINKTTAASAGKYVLVAVNPTGTVVSEEVTVSFTQNTGRAAVSVR